MLKERRNQIVEQTVRQAARKKVRRRVLALLSAVVLVLTTNQLIFFADTLERIETCGLAEHSHTAECYGSDGSLTCELPEHVHTDACYQERPKKAAEEAEEDVVAETDVELDDVSQELEAFELTDDAQALEPETTPEEAIETAAQSYRYIIGAQSAVYLRDIFAAVGLDADDDVEVGQVVDPSHPEGMIRIENTDAGTAIVPTRDFSEVELAVFAKDGIYTVSLLDAAPQAEPESEPEPIEAADTIEVATVEEPAESPEETVEAEPVETAIETQDEVLTDSEPKTEPAEEEQTLVGNDSEAVEPVEEQTEVAIVETVEREAAEVESEPTSEVADTTEGTSEADVESSPEALTVVEETPDETPAEDNEATGEISNEDELTEEATDADDEGEVTEETTDDEVEATEETADADDEVEATEETADDEVEAVEASDTDTINRKIFHATYDLTEAAAPFSLKAWIADAKAAETVVEDADDGEAAEVEPSENEVAEAEPLPVDEWHLTYDAEDIAIEAVEDDWTVTPVRAFEATELSVDTGDAVFALTLLNQAAEDEIELTDDNAEAYVAEIDLTDAVAPFSLAGWMAQARPEDAETAPAEEWTLEYDSDVFAVELTDGDYSVMPLNDFAQAAFAVNAGDARYELTLLNWTAEVPELLTGEISVDVEGANYKLHISVPEEANLPADAMFKAVVVEDASYANAALNAVPTDGESMVLATFDLTIYDAEGRVLQPDVPLDVAVDFNDDLSKLTNVYVVHFPGTGAQPESEVVEEPVPMLKAAPMRAKRAMTVLEDQGLEIEEEAVETEILSTQVIDATHDDNGVVSFQADSFSYYAVVGTIVGEYLSDSGVLYEVKVTYGPEAHIPEGAHLKITEFSEDSADYDYARRAVLADKLAKGETVDLSTFNLAALDISILDANDNEIEPDATVQVDIKIKSLPGVEDLSEIADTLQIQHHIETADGVVVDTVYDGSSTQPAFDVPTNDVAVAGQTAVDARNFNEEDYIATFEEEDEGYELEASFETELFSTYTLSYYYNYYSKNIHYVDTNGNSLTPTMTPNFDARNQFLIYDIEGYEYDSTHVGSRTGTSIPPILRANSEYGLYYSDNVQYRNGNNWSNLNNNDVYVVYKPKSATQGGTVPPITDATWPDQEQPDPETPTFTKSSTNNGDGTNTVALGITAAEKAVENKTKANVIVVFDSSGSMRYNMDGSQTNNVPAAQQRITIAKNAVNALAQNLLSKTDAQGNKLVKMALVDFDTTASRRGTWTDNSYTYAGNTYVGGMGQGGGTNWEEALLLANDIEVADSDAATFVVFVTDGDPTFRKSRGNVSDSTLVNDGDISATNYYANNANFGTGSNQDQARHFDFAVEAVKEIVAQNKNFYAIGISDDVTKVRKLVTDAGLTADHAFLSSDEAAVNAAFNAIANSISATLGFGDIAINDGITEMSNTEMEVMEEVDPDSFTYYRYGGENNKYGTAETMQAWDPAADGCGLASYDDDRGVVKWNMGAGFQLEDGVTYVVKFRVWPSQDAYDLVADLNNNVKTFDSLTDAQKAQIVELDTVPVTYALKTNTNEVNATYKRTSKTGDQVTVSGTQPIDAVYEPGTMQNMDLESMQLTIKKVFEDDLTAGEDRDDTITLVMKRRNAHQTPEASFEDYAVPQEGGVTSANIVLSDKNNWTYTLYVAPGLEVDGEVLEHGYDFTVTEPGIDYHYGLIEEIINPMVVDGQDKYYGDGVLLNGETISEYTDQSITAVNRVKSGIDIAKHVYDTDGTTEIYPDTEFTITGKLLGPNGQPYTWQDGDDVNASGAYHKYDKDGNRIVYKGHFADSSNISFTLKAGEYIRFINVPEGCTFEFTESTTGMDAQGYQWISTDAVTQHRTEPNGPFTPEGDVQPVVSGQTAKLETGVVGNKQYAVTYGNKRTIALPDVELVKVDKDDSTKKLNDAEFALYSDAELTTPVTEDGNGKAINIVTANKENSPGPDGWYHIGLLPAGTYYMVETEAPDKYQLDKTPIIITVTKVTDSYRVTATKNGTSVISGPVDGVYTLTVGNELNVQKVRFKKVDSVSNNPLPGAIFDLSTKPAEGEGETIQTGMKSVAGTGLLTVGEGEAAVNEFELPVGNYNLTETAAPSNYVKMESPVVISVTADSVSASINGTACTVEKDDTGTFVITVKNTRKKARVTVTKVVESTKPSDQNVPFGFWWLNGSAVEFSLVGKEEGYTPEGAELIKHTETFDVLYGDKFTVTEVENTGFTTVNSVNDVQKTEEPLTTGQIEVSETTVKPTDVQGYDGEIEVVFTNTRKTTSVTVVKDLVDEFSDAEQSFTFTAALTDGDNDLTSLLNLGASNSFTLPFSTDEGDDTTTTPSWSRTFSNLPVGAALTITEGNTGKTYTTSVKVNNGQPTTGKEGVVESLSETGNTITFTNKREAGYVEFTKQGEDQTGTKTALQGATFGIFVDDECKTPLQLNGQPVTALSDSYGVVSFKTTTGEGETVVTTYMIPVGTYYMKEIEAPEDYELSDTVYPVTISGAGARGTITGITYDIIPNTPKKAKVLLEKHANSEDGDQLAGAIFALYNSDYRQNANNETPTPRMDKITTFEEVASELGELPVGTYYLVETKAPDGYNKMTNYIRITINGTSNGIQVLSAIGPSSLEEEIKGVTGEDGVTTYTIKAVNYAGYALPHTGGMGTTVFTAGGIALIALALFLLMKKRMAMND